MKEQIQCDASAWLNFVQQRTPRAYQATRRFCDPRRLVSILLLCLGFMPLTWNEANAQIFALEESLLDDFEDGDYRDGSPATWTPLMNVPNEGYISDGDFITDRAPSVTDPNANLRYVELTDTILRDVSIRTQARMLEIRDQGGMLPGLGPAVSIETRTCWMGLGRGHVCRTYPELFESEEFNFIDVRANGEVHTQQSLAAPERVEQTDIRPLEEDFVMQVDAFGGDLKFWVWRPGEPRPADPLIQYTLEDNPNLAHGAVNFGTVYAKAAFRYVQVSDSPITDDPQLFPGDADQDLKFDQLDLVQVQIAGKYLTGQAATWGDGDWDAAPGGTPGSPPTGNGLFDQFDVIAAAGTGIYLTGPYAAVQSDGQLGDGQTSIVYNAGSGEVSVDAPAGVELTSINIDSASGIFTGEAAANLGGSFDNDADNNIFKATFGSSFGSLSFRNVAQTGLSEAFVLGDLTVIGSLAGGGDLGNVDLVYVPEPASALLLAIGLVVGLTRIRRCNH